jgi:Tol biopolymer transport system component
VILGKDCAAACPEYVSLNLETGKVRKIIEFDEDVYMNRVISQSQDGQVVLLYSYNGDQTELWLYDAQKNETILLDKADGLGGGSLSFDGKWVVWQVFERKGDVANSEIWLMNIGDMEKKNLGPGMRPILVQP